MGATNILYILHGIFTPYPDAEESDIIAWGFSMPFMEQQWKEAEKEGYYRLKIKEIVLPD